MEKNKDQYMLLNEVAVPGCMDANNGTMTEYCPKCGKLKKDCTCEKNK